MAVGDCTFTADDLVEKSPNDKRLYRYMQLPNGLCALLVHDPDIYPDGLPEHSGNCENNEAGEDEGSEDEDDEEAEDSDFDEEGEEESDDADEEESEVKDKGSKGASQKKAAAAMCVRMGSFSDPFDAQGLAHFLEHMLFMGSTDFPDENEYDSYLSKHGGCSNAYTETEHTCYHFEVKRDCLKGALRRVPHISTNKDVRPTVKVVVLQEPTEKIQDANDGALIKSENFIGSAKPKKETGDADGGAVAKDSDEALNQSKSVGKKP
ncbi:hypothetical protein HAX54_006673 [Datura stramonium]|uniref:Peptidase M16 N-terminal domain-containing protein n=1 Tax=Datura stramonium TaxID=4076 RepID=A0ABS8TBU9_DATST|nr:hypothetical protein [Datura stramonium]